MDKVAIC